MAKYKNSAGSSVEAKQWLGTSQSGVTLFTSRYGKMGRVETSTGIHYVNIGDWIISNDSGISVMSPVLFSMSYVLEE